MDSGGLKKLKGTEAEKFKDVKIEDLAPVDKEGFLTKQGGGHKSWNKRWFVLKDGHLFYFKNKNRTAPLKGMVKLQANSVVRELNNHKKKFVFEVTVMGRVFLIRGNDEKTRQEWVDALNQCIATGGAKQIQLPEKPKEKNEDKEIDIIT